MTLDQWQDIVSKMTPEQREAMAFFGEACFEHGNRTYDYLDSVADVLTLELAWPVYKSRLNECRGIA